MDVRNAKKEDGQLQKFTKAFSVRKNVSSAAKEVHTAARNINLTLVNHLAFDVR
jgi:tRNA U34 5-methylaminomethyl-2-thiouridine-forming methyltransferase MnmC